MASQPFAHTKRTHVLIADENDTRRTELHICLAQRGYQVIEAGTWAKAVNELYEERRLVAVLHFNVIFDWIMYERSGQPGAIIDSQSYQQVLGSDITREVVLHAPTLPPIAREWLAEHHEFIQRLTEHHACMLMGEEYPPEGFEAIEHLPFHLVRSGDIVDQSRIRVWVDNYALALDGAADLCERGMAA